MNSPAISTMAANTGTIRLISRRASAIMAMIAKMDIAAAISIIRFAEKCAVVAGMHGMAAAQ